MTDEPAKPAPTTMMLYFRLFAGLMSLVLNLYFSHFCESGPAGMLELSVAMLVRLLSVGGGSDFCRSASLDFRPNLFGIIRADDAQENRSRN